SSALRSGASVNVRAPPNIGVRSPSAAAPAVIAITSAIAAGVFTGASILQAPSAALRRGSPQGGPMKITEMNWMQVERYLERDDRAVVPIGSTEQHAGLSLGVDLILSERVSVEAAQPLGVPVFPTLNYGYTPYFTAYPGTISLRIDTLIAIVRDVLDSLQRGGFRRILFVNGHGGNAPAASLIQEWMSDHPGACVRFHNWYNAPKVWKKVQEIDPVAGH